MGARRIGGALLGAALVATGCGANATVLTPTQERYLARHPELGPRGRNALLYRIIEVGDSLERARIAWDGLAFDPTAGRYPDPRESMETFEVRVPVDARPVLVRGTAGEEEIPRGRVLLTFRDGKLATWVRLE